MRVPAANLLGPQGGGFMMAQARLGPGRIHHCMRSLGAAERALELMCARASSRSTFGSPIARHGVVQEWIAESRLAIEQARLLVLKAAWLIDTVGAKGARTEIAAIKVAAPRAASYVLDRAIQVHGGAGVSADTPLAEIVGAPADPAPGRRPGRGAPALDRARGTAPLPLKIQILFFRTDLWLYRVCRLPAGRGHRPKTWNSHSEYPHGVARWVPYIRT